MRRSTPVAVCLLLLSQTCFQARASPTPGNFHPLKDSPGGCLTVIFFLVLSLTVLFIFKKIYVARRRKMNPVSIFSDEFSALNFNQKGRKSMTKAIVKKSGFYVGLLGSPGWETKRSVFIGGDPRHISLPPESYTPSYRRIPFGSSTLHKVPAKCEITSTRPASSNVLGDKPQLLNILSPEISCPPPAMVPPKPPSLWFDTKSSLPTRRLSSPLFAQNNQHSDFQSNENITFNSGPRKLVLVSGPNLLLSRIDHFNVSQVSFPDSKDQINGDDANDSILETAAQDFSVASPHKIPDSPKSCRQSLELSSNSSVRLKLQCSTPTRRTRNSPIIGPSPLRTMSLPSDYDPEHTNFNSCDTLSKIQSESEIKFEPSLKSSSQTHSSPIPKRAKTVLQADDPDIIFDLIRELARETSAWDASLFVDENFKALMDQSTTHPNCKLKVQIAPEKRSKYRLRQRRTTLQDIPESDVAVVFSEENDDWHPYEVQSIWEDEVDSAYQHDAQLQSPSTHVGPFASCRS